MKKKIKELVVAFQAPFVPCCVGCGAVKDKGSVPDITQVLCVDGPILPIGLAVLHKPKIRTGNQSCLSLFTPSWFPPSPGLSKPKLC